MNLRSPLVAMLWEQWRLTRVEAGQRLALGLLAAALALTLNSANGVTIAMWILAGAHGFFWFSIAKLNGGRFMDGYKPGFPLYLLYTRPIRTPVFVGVAMAYDAISCAALYLVSAAFLAVGVGFGAWYLIRPIDHFIQGRTAYADIERRLCLLPRHSALVIFLMYAPMIGLRLLSHRLDITFGAPLHQATWSDFLANLTVGTGFNVVLTFFIVSAYLDRLCEFLFRTRGVNIGIFNISVANAIGRLPY